MNIINAISVAKSLKVHCETDVNNTVNLHNHLQKEESKIGLSWLCEAVDDFNRGRGNSGFKYNLSDAINAIDNHYWKCLFVGIDYEGLVPKNVYKKNMERIENKEMMEYDLKLVIPFIDDLNDDFEVNRCKKVCDLYKDVYGYKPKPNNKGFMKNIVLDVSTHNRTETLVDVFHNMAVVLGVNSRKYEQGRIAITHHINITGEWLKLYNGLCEVKLYSSSVHIRINPIVAKLLNDELVKYDSEYIVDDIYLTGLDDEEFDTSGELMLTSNIRLLLSLTRNSNDVYSFKIPYDSNVLVTEQLKKIVALMGGEVINDNAIFEYDISDKALEFGCNQII